MKGLLTSAVKLEDSSWVEGCDTPGYTIWGASGCILRYGGHQMAFKWEHRIASHLGASFTIERNRLHHIGGHHSLLGIWDFHHIWGHHSQLKESDCITLEVIIHYWGYQILNTFGASFTILGASDFHHIWGHLSLLGASYFITFRCIIQEYFEGWCFFLN